MMTKALTLYELNQMVHETITISMPDEYWVEAEISDIREVRGHCYMELIQKDEYGNTPLARASAKCWKNKWMYISPHFERITGHILRAGMKILVQVYADFHETYGFSWIITDIDPTFTMGDMARKRQDIIRRLQEAGVLELQKELSLPLFTQRIAVISSEQAAGYGDFCNQLAENDYGFQFKLSLFRSIMQGEQIESSIISALNEINRQIDHFDVVVIIRGGGSTSDLSGFDSLLLAENVANFPLPVITGIGHDRDESVLDLVSHIRVKTPTAVATLLIDHLIEVYNRISDAQEELIQMVQRRIEIEKMRLNIISEKVPVLFSFMSNRQNAWFDNLFLRIQNAITNRIRQTEQHLNSLSEMLSPLYEHIRIRENHRLEILQQKIKAQDPMLILNRGYSITTLNGHVIRNAKNLKKGDILCTQMAKGKVTSIVKET
ncbi:exodeoxyribonuclease VII, large subunit [Hoylesella saccharolytica F0055]|uniref:Exodeoxyribonuclease 7 large subunit n=1 Tax=Hoylesella saccharolytica F0055 TaxID=1127699 RepID=L1NIV7_9BACT|nr:exodeoxyribonuclease VII, large subunit [Hoylesella saccharolytica F0055]